MFESLLVLNIFQ